MVILRERRLGFFPRSGSVQQVNYTEWANMLLGRFCLARLLIFDLIPEKLCSGVIKKILPFFRPFLITENSVTNLCYYTFMIFSCK